MGGGLIQLVAYGAQDIYITGNPQITFFKTVYKRHTNFACEAIEQTFNGSPSLGGKATVPITRNGDLVTKMWLKTSASNSKAISVATSATNMSLFEVGTATTISGITLSFQSWNNDGVFVVISNPVAVLTAAIFSIGKVITITGTTGYNGNYLVYQTGNNFVVGLQALSNKIPGTHPSELNINTATVTHYASQTEFTWNTDLGYALIKSVELQIGGTKIDKHYGRWMHIWSQLTRTKSHHNAHNEMIDPASHTNPNKVSASHELYIPLQFYFCRNNGLALPLIALQYHDVRLEFEFETAANIASSGANVSLGSNTKLLVNYIYLDSEERNRFAQASHEYLIEQLQFTGVETVLTSRPEKIPLYFNHPIKELVWVQESAWGTFSPVTDSLLQLNGHDRFTKQPGKFFNYVQSHSHHTRAPSVGINVYSFALNPEEHQPSGSCNFSRIDNATLIVNTGTTGTSLYVYGVNYNILRIMSGMGGIAYSN